MFLQFYNCMFVSQNEWLMDSLFMKVKIAPSEKMSNHCKTPLHLSEIWWLPDSPRYRAAVRGGFSRSRPMMTMHLWHFLGVMLTCLATSLPRVDGKMRQVTRNWLNLIAAFLLSGHEDRQRPRRLRRRCGRCTARRPYWRPALLIAKPISLTTGNRDQLIKEIGNVWPVVQSQKSSSLVPLWLDC